MHRPKSRSRSDPCPSSATADDEGYPAHDGAPTHCRLVAGIIPLLVIAGCLEGFFSPSQAPVWLKFTVGGVLFVLLNLWLFRRVKAGEV